MFVEKQGARMSELNVKNFVDYSLLPIAYYEINGVFEEASDSDKKKYLPLLEEAERLAGLATAKQVYFAIADMYDNIVKKDAKKRIKYKAQIKTHIKKKDPKDFLDAMGSFLKQYYAAIQKDGGETSELLLEVFKNKSPARGFAIKYARACLKSDSSLITSIFQIANPLRKHVAWVKNVLEALGAKVSAIEEIEEEVGAANQLAEEIGQLEQQIKVSDPVSQESATLEVKKRKKKEKLSRIIQESKTPEVIAATALSTIEKASINKTAKRLNLTAEGEKILLAEGKILVAATAGSGKTTTLAAKIVDLLEEQKVDPNSLLVTSFSRKSAKEIENRVLNFATNPSIVDTSGMGTTHSIAGRLIKDFGEKSLPTAILEDWNVKNLYEVAIKQVSMKSAFRVTAEELEEDDSFFSPREINKILTQKAPSAGKPQFWKGRGKRASTTSEFILEVSQKLSSVFKKQGKEIPSDVRLAEKTAKLAIASGVVDAEAQDIFHRVILAFSKTANVSKIKDWEKQPANQWFNQGLDPAFAVGAEIEVVKPREVILYVSKWKGNLISPKQALQSAKTEKQRFAAFAYGAYEWLKKNSFESLGKRDHDDTLVMVCQLLIAKPEARLALQRQYKHIFIDEAQDLNEAQHLLFGLISGTHDPLTRKPYEDGRTTAKTVCFIGDTNQAIYAFRGATPEKFSEKSEMTEGGETFKTLTLSTNFRSGSSIVESANRLAAHSTNQIPMVCRSNPQKGMGSIRARVFLDEGECAANAAGDIVQAVHQEQNSNFGDFGICLRTNKEVDTYVMAMIERGVPFISRRNPLKNAVFSAIRGWVQLVSFGMNGGNYNTDLMNEIVVEAHKIPNRMLGNVFVNRLREIGGTDYFQFLKGGGWKRIYDQAFRNNSVKEYIDTIEACISLGKSSTGKTPEDILRNLLKNVEGAKGKTLAQAIMDIRDYDTEEETETPEDKKQKDIMKMRDIEFFMSILNARGGIEEGLGYLAEMDRLSKKLDKTDEEKADAVQLDTIHQWKGLEAKHVYTSFGSDFPSKKWAMQASIEEDSGAEKYLQSERRLAYVAITRGQESVVVYQPLMKNGKEGLTSQFFAEACIPFDSEGSPLTKESSSEKFFEKLALLFEKGN